MIPIRDYNPSSTFPLVTVSIITVNTAIFIYMFFVIPDPVPIVDAYGLIPARYTGMDAVREFGFLRLAVAFYGSFFIHGGLLHLFGNMWFLWIFGDNIEDRLGHLRFVLFYLLAGTAGGILFILTNPNAEVPCIGASGAVAGVLGAYMVIFPGAQILTLIPIFILFYFVTLPAFIVLLIWFLIQLLNAHVTGGLGSQVAWWAHVGGFVIGIVLILFMKKRKSFRNRS